MNQFSHTKIMVLVSNHTKLSLTCKQDAPIPALQTLHAKPNTLLLLIHHSRNNI